MGKKDKKKSRKLDLKVSDLDLTPAQYVKKMMKAGKVKKKCCRSKDRCRRCPVLALKKAKTQLSKAA